MLHGRISKNPLQRQLSLDKKMLVFDSIPLIVGLYLKLIKTTNDFLMQGISFPGIPILVYDSMELEESANDFLLWVVLENTRTSSPATGKAYAESLYDFFSWLEANDFDWRPSASYFLGKEISILNMYRNWCVALPCLAQSTLRKRLIHVREFYKWAHSKKKIDGLPWEGYSVKTPLISPPTKKDTLYFPARSKPLKLLNLNQCKQLLEACPHKTLKLITKLILQTGLRNEECRSFPKKYLFDPCREAERKHFPLNLDPKDMKLKGSKSRRIYVTWQLMKDLFDYVNFEEGTERHRLYRMKQGVSSPLIFLNKDGNPFNEKSLNNSYRKLWDRSKPNNPRLSFTVTPHMLRHTFATFELFGESKRTNLGNALAWVRDRLGHKSVLTTSIYVHCLELLTQNELNQYQEELDHLGSLDEKSEVL